MKKVAIIISYLFFTLNCFSQKDNHDHEHHHPEFEIGFSNGLVYNVTEKEAAYNIHVHFVKTIGKSDKFGLGIGYEKIFDDHKHNAASIIFLFRPIEHFSINIAPGVSWLETESNSLKPAMHFEGLYEIELGNFHVGPLIGIAFNTEDFHASVGLHLAFGF